MIEKILSFSLRHPFVILFFTLAISLYGIYSFTRLPIDAVPDITNNQVQINTEASGFSPEQVENQVTFVIETSLAGIPGLQMTRSLSRNSFSQVTAIFDDNIDIYFARQQINERLVQAKESLPHGVDPHMGPISTGLGEVYMWIVSFKHPNGAGADIRNGLPGWQQDGSYMTPDGQKMSTDVEKASYLRTLQDWVITPQLKSIQGLAEIDTIGGYIRQYHVEPNIEKLIALGLSFDVVADSIRKNNLNIGPGYIERNGEAYLVKADERLHNIEDIENIVIGHQEGGSVRIKDIAQVVIGKEIRTGSASSRGNEAVIGTAMMLIGANSRTVSQEVDKRVQGINKSLPIDVEVIPVLNRTKLVDATIHTVSKNLGEGALLVIAVLFSLLGYFRAAFITALVIPISMLMTATGMTLSKISGNLMSLGAIDFGLIVDGSVIIIENCIRCLSMKQKELGRYLTIQERSHEILTASKEMIKPSVYGQAIILIVYIPLLTLSGVEGKMFYPMAMTVIIALASAFVLSITFIPAMVTLCIKGHLDEKENWFIGLAKKIYRPFLRQSLNYPFIPIASAVVAVILSLTLFSKLGQEFVPTLDEKDIAMHAMRIPSVSLDQSTAMQLDVEKALIAFPEVEQVFSKTGTAEMASDPMPPNISDTFIILKPREQWPNPDETKLSFINRLSEAVERIPGNNYEFTQPIEMRFNELISGSRSDVAIKIYGDHFEGMQKAAQHVAKVLSSIKGAADVEVAKTSGQPILEMKMDRAAASRLGINVSDVLTLLSAGLGGEKAGEIFEGDRRFALVVKLPEEERFNVTAIGNLPIFLPVLKKGHQDEHPYIPLNSIVAFNFKEGLNEIKRENGKRFIDVQANVRGSDLGRFVESSKQAIQSQVSLPEGSWIVFGGQFENLISARNRLALVIPICFLLILMILYMAFDSFRYALIVFTGVPLALTGGIVALWLRDIPFSISAAVGFIALSGIAVLNGLVLLSYMNQLIKEGESLDCAITNGALTRLRPVLMTALVASLGFVPMALATGTGAEVQKPLATVVIGGLASATILTLIVLPALYKVFFSRKEEHCDIPASSELRTN